MEASIYGLGFRVSQNWGYLSGGPHKYFGGLYWDPATLGNHSMFARESKSLDTCRPWGSQLATETMHLGHYGKLVT